MKDEENKRRLEALLGFVRRVSERVASWPEWKRNVTHMGQIRRSTRGPLDGHPTPEQTTPGKAR